MNNFEFLKSVDKNLYDIIAEAERLYRDEYFEQSITQTRRFAENVCKTVLGNMRTTEKTFDDMLATLKDKACNSKQEKEFVEDLYFLKREGNNSVHSAVVKKDGIVALECLQRAFEAAINYAVYNKKADSKLLKIQYDTEMLVTGERSKKTLAEKYKEEKTKSKTTKKVNKKKSKSKIAYEHKPKLSVFKGLVYISFVISAILVLITLLLLAI